MQPEQSGLGTLAELVDVYARHALAEVLQQDPNFSQGTPRGTRVETCDRALFSCS